jgi:O-antigen ligase
VHAHRLDASPLLRKLSLYVLLLGLLLLPLIIVPYVPTQTPAVHSKDWLSRCLCAFALPLSAAFFFRARRSLDLVDVAFGAFVASQVVSTILSGRFVFSFLENWHNVAWVVTGWVAWRLNPSVADYRKVAAIVGLVGVASALYGLLTYAGVNVLGWLYPFQFRTEEGGRNYIHSFFGNPEYFGGYAAPVLVLCASRCMQLTGSARSRIAWAGASFLLLAALGLSGSRGAFFGVLVGGALLVARQLPLLPNHARRLALQVIAAGFVVVALAVLVLSTSNPLNRRDMRLAQRFAEATDFRSASSRERLLFYVVTARAVTEHPVFGAGPGTYRLDFFPNFLKLEQSDPTAASEMMAIELRNRLAEHPHNDYLEYWYELGTVGIVALMFIIALSVVRFWSQPWRATFLDSATTELQVLNSGFFAACVCLLVNAASSFPLHMPARATLFWTLLGCFFASDRQLRQPRQTLPLHAEF